uniref:MANSC domain-containing protein n=1 Tax=Leptobrachium leishanense TaxID=445787 RepID=A0A8C5PH24_9ANUR
MRISTVVPVFHGCPWLLYTLLLLWGTDAIWGSEKCYTNSMPHMVIDITPALQNGVRSMEPIHTDSPEDCIAACCKEYDISGGRACNLLVYDTRKVRTHPNCYLFNCPSQESCTMAPSTGIMSYSLFRGIFDRKSHPYPTYVENPQPPLSKKNNVQISGIEGPERQETSVLLQSDSARKGPSPAFYSPYPAGKESGSVDHSQSAAGKKSNSAIKKSDSVVHLQDYTGKNASSDDYVQNSAGKRPASVSHLVNAADKETLLPKVDDADDSSNHIQKSLHVKPASKDTAEAPSSITSKMVHLTEKIEKDLENMVHDPEHDSDNSSQVFYPSSPEPKSISRNSDRTQQNGLQPAGKEIQPDDTNETQSTTVKAHLPLFTARPPKAQTETPPPKLKSKISALFPVPFAKSGNISTKSVSNSINEDLEHAIDNIASHLLVSSSPKDVFLDQSTTKTKVQGHGHKTLATLPITHRTPFLSLTTKTLTTTQKSTNRIHTPEPKQPVTVVLKVPDQASPLSNNVKPGEHILNPVVSPKKFIPEVEKHSISEDVSGLVAALVFGVVFLLVVIGLIGHKVSEARRRHQYNKLDYLINGMYVDT